MRFLTHFATERPIAVTVFAIVVMLVGIVSWKQLPLDLFPDVQSPTVMVSISSEDRPATEIERQFGERVEQLLFSIPGVRAIDQVARRGRLISRVTFGWDSDIDLAIVEVNRAISGMSGRHDVDEVLVRRFDSRQLPVIVAGLTLNENYTDLAELRRIAKRQLAPNLEQLEGVAEVYITGGRVKEAQIQIDPVRLKAYGLTIADLQSSILNANIDINAGTLTDGDRVFQVRGMSRFLTLEDIENVVIKYVKGEAKATTAIKLSDIAKVNYADADIRNLVRINGKEGVGISIYKEFGTNTVTVSRTVREAIDALSASLPQITTAIISDEAMLVENAIADVENSALIGIALATLVLFFYLRSVGPVIIVAIAVPVSLLATVFAMRTFDYSLNLMTLGGIALGAGILVDNAIVVIESIFRQMEMGDSPKEAASKGTAFVSGPIITSTLTSCIVFLPVVFIDGLASKLVSGLAFTVILSLLASLLVAIFLIPALSIWLLPQKRASNIVPGSKRLEALVLKTMQRPKTVLMCTALLAGLAVYVLAKLGTELLPPSDPRQFTMRVVGPPGQSVESTAHMVAIVEDVLTQSAGDGLVAVMAEVGRMEDNTRHIREQQTEENTADLRVRLSTDAPSPEKIVAMANPVTDQLYGVDVSWNVGHSTLSQALGTSGPPVVVKIAGNSLDDIHQTAVSLQQTLQQIPALWNVKNSFEGGPSELRIRLKRKQAEMYGVDVGELATLVRSALQGLKITEFALGDEMRDVVVKLPQVDTNALLSLQFRSASGHLLALSDIAHIEETPGAKEILRSEQKRSANVTALIAPGYALPEVRALVVQALHQLTLPPGITASLAGEELERQKTFQELQWVSAAALLLVLMVIAGSFESLLLALTILAAIPVSLIGVAITLGLDGSPIGVMAMLGLIMLMGIAVNDAILLIHTAKSLIDNGCDKTVALARAAAIRLRPITMTTATTVLALLPMAIDGGDAAALRSPLALTVIGGIIASTIGALFVLPCIYLVFDRPKVLQKPTGHIVDIAGK